MYFSLVSQFILNRFLRRTIVALVLFAGSCARESGGAFRGVAVATPIVKPQFTLTDVNGRPYDFARETRGKVTLLFFGYTHCPDACPLHMANIAAVLKQMPFEERNRIVTVFVTTDPERDTPERLKGWLANFDPSFVGLTGTKEEVEAAQSSLGLRLAYREYAGTDSVNYFVAHAAQVFAFSRDGYAYLLYPFGTRQEDWASDLPRLVRDASGEGIRRALALARNEGTQSMLPQKGKSDDVTIGGLMVTQAVIAEPATQTEAALYLTFRNDTPQEDTLVAVISEVAARAEIHETTLMGDMRHMSPVSSVVLPARTETRLAPGGTHAMLLDLNKRLRAGDSVTVLLTLSRAGALEARAVVVPYAELQRMLEPKRQ